MTPAEERAAREGLPVVRLVPLEAARVAAGNPLIIRLADGQEVLVRLYTVDEFLDVQHAAADEYGTARITRQTAEEILWPIGGNS